MNFDFSTWSSGSADGMANYLSFNGLTDECAKGDLMFIQIRPKRGGPWRFAVYRLELKNGRKKFLRVPQRWWDKGIQAEVAMRVMYLNKE